MPRAARTTLASPAGFTTSAAGQGTAPAFIGVALAFLGLFLLGWRLLAGLAARLAVR